MSKSKKPKPNKAFNAKGFAQAIIDKRFSEEATQVQAAKAIGISRSTIIRLEQLAPITIETLVAGSNWLGVEVQSFFI